MGVWRSRIRQSHGRDFLYVQNRASLLLLIRLLAVSLFFQGSKLFAFSVRQGGRPGTDANVKLSQVRFKVSCVGVRCLELS